MDISCLYLSLFESGQTRSGTQRTHTATKLHSTPDNTSNPPKRETVLKKSASKVDFRFLGL